ncbi:glyoxalase [Nocardia brasiliensis]|uniref:Glyoxalase n=1 Tax=Nocardia brasiliensis TaxID=37326 RepID=A0A6G9XUL2_NOCBR|nr:glyoxalase [Nocardia brasiliensis]QIS04540.1 glyoxalase [Nocardia brasiliensis]
MGDTAVPVLWGGNSAETLEFYRALGYQVTWEQHSPYVYLSVQRNGYELHFYRDKKDKREVGESQMGCLVMVDEVAELHAAFSKALRAHYGRIPARGVPRISRFRPGQTRFTVLDPGGNSVTYIQRGEPEFEYGGSRELQGLQRVLDNARILRFSKEDDEAARKTLEAGLRRFDATASTLDKARALAELTELAVAMGDPARADELRARITALDLAAEERAEIAAQLKIADELAEWLDQAD